MMKIFNSVVVLMILINGSQLSHGGKLECEFFDESYLLVGRVYSCYVTSLNNPHNNLMIDGYSGEHKPNKNDADVQAIWVWNTNIKYIPMNLGSLFNLTALRLDETQLVEIKAKDFHGMQDLEIISLNYNKLSSVPLDAFATLTKLRIISLGWNQIEELPNGIFAKNLELQQIQLSDNKIKYLGTGIFNGLEKLHFVYLQDNICVKKDYLRATGIIQLKDDIIMKCKNPNEVPLTTQNPMEVNLIEMQEKISKLKKELREAKELQQKNNDALKKELKEAKELLQKNEAMNERDVKDINQKILNEMMNQLLNTIDVQQKNRVVIEKLRTELSESKDEQL